MDEKLASLIKINLDCDEPAERWAWLSTAILTHLDLKVELTEYAQGLIQIIRSAPKQCDFKNLVNSLAEEDEFGITELTHEDAQRVIDFVCQPKSKGS